MSMQPCPIEPANVQCTAGRDVSAAARTIVLDLIVLDMQIGMGGIATALSLEQEFEDGSTPAAPILLPRPAGRRAAGPALGGRRLAHQAARPVPPAQGRPAPCGRGSGTRRPPG